MRSKLTPFDNPVYRAQCRTWKRCLELHGIRLEPGQGFATRGNENDPRNAFYSFRALPQFRNAAASALRLRVALTFRAERGNRDRRGTDNPMA